MNHLHLNRRNLLRLGAAGGAAAGAAVTTPLLLPRGSTASNHTGHEGTPTAGETGNDLERPAIGIWRMLTSPTVGAKNRLRTP